MGANGDAAEILAHPWFADLDMTALQNFELEAPLIPGGVGRGSEVATQYFEARTGDKALNETVIPKANLKIIKKHTEDFLAFDQRPNK